ncbi:hypothetical protein EDB87DRAFT_1417644 [Lactarius vividus]|nr:hypothetical protein EDB87DRAFT_1417644 [Lactarius vividus]
MRDHSNYRSMTDLTRQACTNYIHTFTLRQRHEHERTPLSPSNMLPAFYGFCVQSIIFPAHQIRVHIQYLGDPIADHTQRPKFGRVFHYSSNLYTGTKPWKRGIDTTPSGDRAPPVAPAHLVEQTLQIRPMSLYSLILGPGRRYFPHRNFPPAKPEKILAWAHRFLCLRREWAS